MHFTAMWRLGSVINLMLTDIVFTIIIIIIISHAYVLMKVF